MTEVTPGADPAPPSTPAEAATRLDALKANPDWTGKLMAGGSAELKEFQGLHELLSRGDHIDLALAGEFMPGGMQTPEHLQNMGATSMLREAGVRDEVIRDVLAGTHTVTKEEFAKVKQFKADRMSDKEWSKRLLAGDSEATRQFHLMNIVLTGDIKAA
jgi:hypothetical protein